MNELLGFLGSNEWAAWSAAIVAMLIALRGLARLTPMEWDDKVIAGLLSVFGMVAPRQTKRAKEKMNSNQLPLLAVMLVSALTLSACMTPTVVSSTTEDWCAQEQTPEVLQQRRNYLAAADATAKIMGLPARPQALDCDGDGTPDFTLD